MDIISLFVVVVVARYTMAQTVTSYKMLLQTSRQPKWQSGRCQHKRASVQIHTKEIIIFFKQNRKKEIEARNVHKNHNLFLIQLNNFINIFVAVKHK